MGVDWNLNGNLMQRQDLNLSPTVTGDFHSDSLNRFDYSNCTAGMDRRQVSAAVTPAHRGLGAAQPPPADPAKAPTPRHVAMSWARRLKRVFGIEIEGCVRCGGALRIIASIEEPQVIAKILSHLQRTARDQYPTELPLGARAPPVPFSLL